MAGRGGDDLRRGNLCALVGAALHLHTKPQQCTQTRIACFANCVGASCVRKYCSAPAHSITGFRSGMKCVPHELVQ
eukprot:1153895-Pelagomonas_calceolata.AAC.5